MSRYSGYSDDQNEQQPITWLRGYPIYAATLILVVYVASMIATTLLMAFKVSDVALGWTMFTSDDVLHGQVWRLGTYGLYNEPSLWFVVDMFIIGWFGRELEKFFGRSLFLRFYACIYFLPPLAFTLLGFRWPMTLVGECGAFSIFIAFATLYPNVPLLFGILAKWLAVISVGLSTLMSLSAHAWFALAALWITVGFAWCFVRYEQGRFTLPRLQLFRRRPKLRVLPDLPGKKGAIEITATPVKARRDDSMAEIDALLDKIAQSGIGSLTAKERAKLEKGREKLLKRESGGR